MQEHFIGSKSKTCASMLICELPRKYYWKVTVLGGETIYTEKEGRVNSNGIRLVAKLDWRWETTIY